MLVGFHVARSHFSITSDQRRLHPAGLRQYRIRSGLRGFFSRVSPERLSGVLTLRRAGRFAVVLLISLLCGCAWMRANLLSPIPAGRRHIVLLASAPLTLVGGQRYTGAGQKQDYMLLRGSAGQAELVYVRAISYQNEAAIKYHGDRLREFTANWAINAGGIHNWGRSHVVNTPLAPFRYMPYTSGQPGRNCAAFQALWDVLPGDAYGRPEKLIFGYYCARPGAAFDTATLKQFLSSLRIGFYSGADQQVMSIPVLPARSAGDNTGYHSFPQLLPIYRRPLFDMD